jgi:DNA modification methylase
MTPYLELSEPKCLLYNADVLQAELAPESVDLIVTSPPYNVEVVYGCTVTTSATLSIWSSAKCACSGASSG